LRSVAPEIAGRADDEAWLHRVLEPVLPAIARQIARRREHPFLDGAVLERDLDVIPDMRVRPPHASDLAAHLAGQVRVELRAERVMRAGLERPTTYEKNGNMLTDHCFVILA